ncbi:hypothetical protein TSUD_235240 [Trifolium subterraneum]|uniref:Uncharacterized protein n=1 Tax=Trifolium subterraneum TaxID=3900 RepID=A0A2Z6P2F3_TRISU|nr:hypothetical protein TSUD_235240 [Trifolium subterraneum]
MKGTSSVASVGIVPEVLTFDNYGIWNVIIKNYLMGQGLWDVVIHGGDDTQHFNNTPDIEQVVLDLDLDLDLDDSIGQQHTEQFRRVERGDCIGNIDNYLDVYMTSASSRTLLHIAAMAGNVENVKMLVEKGSDRLLLMQDKHGDTALSLVARYTGNTDIAKCLAETKTGPHERLLEMENKENDIPILMAAANGHKELTTYLYSKTPSKVLDGINSKHSKNRVLLLERCIAAEIFDVALKLLNSYPDLFIEASEKSSKLSVLVALAKLPHSFPSDSGFGLLDQFIYDFLSVEKEFAKNYGNSNANIAEFVRSVTRGVNGSKHKTSSTESWSTTSVCLHVLNALILPVKLLGRLIRKFGYLLVHMLVQILLYHSIFGK